MRGINHGEDFGWSAVARLFGLSTGALVGLGTATSGVASGIGSLFGSGKSSSASKSAAQSSLESTVLTLQQEQSLYNNAVSYLSPYTGVGYSSADMASYLANQSAAANPGQWYYDQATGQLQQAAGYQQQGQNYLNQSNQYLSQAAGMTPPSQMTEAYLQNTPGYQFQLQQGLQSTQAAAAARGLGVSGASLKGAATYATGLADSNYQNQFNNAQTAYQDVMNQSTQSLNQLTGANNLASAAQNTASGYVGQGNAAQQAAQQAYNQSYNLASLGESAAAGSSQAATSTASTYGNTAMTGASQYGNYLSQSGQAQAAGTTGASNALTSAANSYLTYNALTGLNQSIAGSGSGGYGNVGQSYSL